MPTKREFRRQGNYIRTLLAGGALALLLFSLSVGRARGEAMIELFQEKWTDLTTKMPELAEAGYDSLWLPNPAKGNSGSFSIGYDVFDPFDLGNQSQQGTIATKYGTMSELLQMVQTAHRFGIRVYFDNVMNHRSGSVPGFNASTPTNYYPGLVPGDFHLQVTATGYKNWADVSDYCSIQNVENNPLLGLCDLANEPGTVNFNFGTNYGNTATKPVFVRFPNLPDLYMDTNSPFLGTGFGGKGWHGFNGTNGQPVAEDVSVYLCRAVAWTMYVTKCDGFRLDAVKHTPVNFFGNETGQTDDPAFAGYTGAIQAMYDYVHGYGSNVIQNGYIETDGNRNSLFNTESVRNDAMVFGEYIPAALSQGQDFYDYLNSGMRLLNQPLYNQMNGILGGGSMSGLDQRDYTPPGQNCDANGNFSTAQGVNMPQTQDGGTCCPANEGMEDAYFFMREGVPGVYSDGFNHNTGGGTPIESFANFLGENSDNSMPDIMYLHNQLSRGGTSSRWSDQNITAFERYDYREGTNTQPQNQDVVLFVMNDKTSFPGDITFDDGVGQASDGYYGNVSVSNSKNVGLVVGFPPGSVLSQLASSSPTGGRAYPKLLVHAATTSLAAAQAAGSTGNADPAQRLIYVGGQTLATGGGAIELNIPSGSWVMYGYQWPEASRANFKNAIILQQNGQDAARMTVYRHDGVNGDTNYNPVFPFKMRGSVDPNGNIVGGAHVSNLTYAVDMPIITNALLDILVRSDASSANTLVKLDGGIDLNNQMGIGVTNSTGLAPTNFPDFRDNRPGYTDDVFLGYERTAFQYRRGPEKFAARLIARDTVTSLGAETYYYTIGSTNQVVNGNGNGNGLNTSTATWIYHDPANTNTAAGNGTATQMVPAVPTNGQPVDLWVKVGYNFQTNQLYLYYTTDGTNPEGAFGVAKPGTSTKTILATWIAHDVAGDGSDWWKVTIPGSANTSGTQVRYKLGVDNSFTDPIGDPDNSKLYGLTQQAITNFNPKTAVVWLDNDLNPADTITGLQEGFHIIRARTFLPRSGKSSVYNTFSQTFYYDAGNPAAVFAAPATNVTTISNNTYQVIVRADSTATSLDYNIIDSDPNNDDTTTLKNNGNGLTNGQPSFVTVLPVTPTASLSTNPAYASYPVEFRFNYLAVPTNGTATITVRIKKATTAILPDRITTLTNTVNTVASSQYVHISDPAADGVTLTLGSNDVHTINICFSQGLAGPANIDYFSIYINGVLQPRRDGFGTPLYNINVADPSCGAGSRLLTDDWTGAQPGTNVIQVTYANSVVLSDTRTVIVVPPAVVTPPAITGLVNRNEIFWASVSNYNYQVLATTNLDEPFAPVGPVIPASGPSSYFIDDSTNADARFYQIEVLP